MEKKRYQIVTHDVCSWHTQARHDIPAYSKEDAIQRATYDYGKATGLASADIWTEVIGVLDALGRDITETEDVSGLSEVTDVDEMRLRVLTAVADAVLIRHTRHLATDSEAPLAVSPAAALVTLITEAQAYWAVETSFEPHTVERYREIADEMRSYAMEKLAGVVARQIRLARQAAGLSH